MEVLHPKIEKDWVRAIQMVRLGQQDSAYTITVKAVGPFSPELINGAVVYLILVTSPGKWAVISGELELVQDRRVPRGMWFAYVFKPRKTKALQTLIIAGRNQFSNVDTIYLRLYTENNYFYSNPWFRTPEELRKLERRRQQEFPQA